MSSYGLTRNSPISKQRCPAACTTIRKESGLKQENSPVNRDDRCDVTSRQQLVHVFDQIFHTHQRVDGLLVANPYGCSDDDHC